MFGSDSKVFGIWVQFQRRRHDYIYSIFSSWLDAGLWNADVFALCSQMSTLWRRLRTCVGAWMYACFVLLRRKIQTWDCPCQSATRAATPSSPWPKTTRTLSCPRTCSCQGSLKELPLRSPPSPAGGTSPTQSELNMGFLSLWLWAKNECDIKEQDDSLL